jgi:hypothetical protein
MQAGRHAGRQACRQAGMQESRQAKGVKLYSRSLLYSRKAILKKKSKKNSISNKI